MSGGSVLAANESRVVFSLGPVPYTVRDIFDAAWFRGEMQPMWDNLLRLMACEERAVEEERDPDEDAIDSAAQTFRYDHDLITAEETERWLAERGLDLVAFSDYFARHYWEETLGDSVTPRTMAYTSAPAELRELLTTELVLSGELDRMAARLSWRVALVESGEKAPERAVAQAREDVAARLRKESIALSDWLAALGRNEEWLDEMARLEAAFAACRERVSTPQARKRELGSLRLQLTVFEVEIIEFDSQDAAREALFCVRDDGMSMEEVAREGRYPFRREQILLEDIPPEIQQQFLSVSPGETLDPMELEGSHRLFRIAGKSEPDPEDAAVRERVERRILDRHFTDLVSRHVRWENLLSQPSE